MKYDRPPLKSRQLPGENHATPALGHHSLALLAANRLGFLGRVCLLFSKRGLQPESLHYHCVSHQNLLAIHLEVRCHREHLDLITRDLHRLIDLISLNHHEVGEDATTNVQGKNHGTRTFLR